MSNHPHLRPAANGKPAVTPPPVPGLPTAELPPGDEMRLALEKQQAQERQIRDNLAALLADPAQLLQRLPEIYGQAVAGAVAAGVAEALAQFTPKPHRRCTACSMTWHAWYARHAAEVGEARKAAEVAVAAAPALAQQGLFPFLPAHLRPASGGAEAMPVVASEDVIVNGTGYCTDHQPGIPQAGLQGGHRPILIATGALTPAMIREAGGIPGLPAMAGMGG